MLMMELTKSVDKSSTVILIGRKRTPKARLSLSLSDISSICLRSRSMPINPIKNMGRIDSNLDWVVVPNVPMDQYSMAASSFSGSAKYFKAMITAFDTALIIIPAKTKVEVEVDPVALTNNMTQVTASSPPQKAPVAMPSMPEEEIVTMATAAPPD